MFARDNFDSNTLLDFTINSLIFHLSIKLNLKSINSLIT